MTRFHRRRTSAIPAALVIGCWCSSPLVAQGPMTPRSVENAPIQVLERLGVHRATVQDLVLPTGDERTTSLEVAIVLDRGVAEPIRVEQVSILDERFQLWVDKGFGPEPAPHHRPRTFRGFATNRPGSTAALSWRDDGVRGIVTLIEAADAFTTWVIQPLSDLLPDAPEAHHIVYRSDALRDDIVHARCEGVRGTPPRPLRGGQDGVSAASLPQIDECEVAFDCDFAYFQRNGSSVAATQDAVTDLALVVDGIYRRDAAICYSITAIIVRTAPVYTMGPDLGCSGMGPGLLDEMVTLWSTQQTGTPRDVAHLISGQGLALGAAGCAFFNAVCNDPVSGFGYGSTRAVSDSFFTNAALIAHELGHNWSAVHCDGQAGCAAMCTFLGTCGPFDRFGPNALAQIAQFRSGVPCLSTCPGCTERGAADFSAAGCPGSGTGTGAGCVALNFTSTNANLVYNESFVAAIPANTGPVAQSIESVEFFVRAVTPLNVTVELLAADPVTGLPGTPLATTSLAVGTPLTTYTASFTSPVGIPAATDFFVALTIPGPSFIVPFSAPGGGLTPVPWQFLSAQGAWFEQPPEPWHYRLNCEGLDATPLLSTLGTPRLGETFAITLDAARPSSLAALLWGSTPIQADLTVLGAPGCALLVDNPFFVAEATTSPLGGASWVLQGPTSPVFCTTNFLVQALVLDPGANALQVAVSRRAALRFGN